jgi:SNF2 family DNA or RNA helicase
MKVRALKQGDRILVQFTTVNNKADREEAKYLAKLVPGGRWQDRSKCWSYLATIDNCKRMRRAWGDNLQVHVNLSSWYRLESEAAKTQVALGRAKDAALEVVQEQAPRLYAEIGDWQRAGAAWMVNSYRNGGLIVDEPGIGKTRTVLAGLLERGSGRILVSCPRVSVKTVWGHEIGRLIPDLPVYLARGTRAKRQKAINDFNADPAGQKVLVVVAEMLRIKGYKKKKSSGYTWTGFEYPSLFEEPWDAVVVDESHTLLGSLTIRKGTLAGEGLCRLPMESTRGLRLCVTGSPWGKGGKVQGMFGALHWCWPDEFPSFWRWAEENFEVKEQYVGQGKGTDGYVKVIGGLKRGMTEKAFFDSLGPRLLRRTMEEVKPGRQKPNYWELVCELEGEQLRQYKAIAQDAEVAIKGGVLTTVGTLDYLTRARQIANGVVAMRAKPATEGREGPEVDDEVFFTGESNKVDVLMQQLEEYGILDEVGTKKVVIASQWTTFLRIIELRLQKEGVEYLILTGKNTDRQRDRAQERFQQPGGPRVFLLSSKAGGLSINLDAADALYQTDRIYPPDAEDQLHRRIIRMSRDHPVDIFFLHSEGTVDERTAEALSLTLHEQLRVLDHRRGMEVVREVVKYQGEKG